MNNCGFSETEAKQIEKQYHKLYQVAVQWVEDQLDEAVNTGYVTCAFGLKLRTPILAQTISTGSNIPHLAQQERRSAGNAVSGQSYCMLTTRAGIEFQERCLNSKYKYDILPAAQIHDSLYFLCKDRPGIVQWVNKHLSECMAWQELEELKHPTIKLTAGLEIYWPNWSNTIGIPKNADKKELQLIAKKAKELKA